ncbi:MAG: PASTA domain-containing protein [candidate division Zixibacteria bacterium]|nr:PASTA domain-containing protein [candidate division Zixibacteria bacterium]
MVTEAAVAEQTVPNFIGLDIEKVEKMCRLDGIKIRTIEFEESLEPEGRIIVQNPQADQPVPAEGIRLVVSGKNYLDFLPNIYRQYDMRQGSILKRFLWLLKHPRIPIDRTIRDIHSYFEPYNTPGKFLPYLASVLALVLDENWDQAKKRELIANIVKIYKLRGTSRGLALYLKIYTDSTPEIIENYWPFNGFQVGVSSTIGVDSIIIGYINRSHCFTVRIPQTIDDTPVEMIRRIHAIVQTEKPAHTNYYMIFAEPELEEADFMQVGVASMIGVESWVGETDNVHEEIEEGKQDDRGE